MYGGIDRSQIPEFKEADAWFVSGLASAFGSREAAASAFVNKGFELYRQDDLQKAMRRFNQAWLLDPKNQEVYWGFASVLQDRAQNCEAANFMERAHDLGIAEGNPFSQKLLKGGFMADMGRIYALCGRVHRDNGSTEAARYFSQSGAAYAKAIGAQPESAYVYASWATALYWRGDYVGAWSKIERAEALGAQVGAEIPAQFIRLLSEAMPRP